jgi:hypothetical protein
VSFAWLAFVLESYIIGIQNRTTAGGLLAETNLEHPLATCLLEAFLKFSPTSLQGK